TSPFVDVSAASMLVDLKSTLARRGIDFRIARDIGQVRDALRQAGEAPRLEIDTTIDDAFAAYERKAIEVAGVAPTCGEQPLSSWTCCWRCCGARLRPHPS
ncbi:MAG TPA: STAS domain-containing protein, partial [Propionibacteriaceae bacterium]|nr:STAS domain-containing protein [Propionibacteriaceae bacterium]